MTGSKIPLQNSDTEELDFDPEALRRKYLLERDRRMRADGPDQYIEVAGDLSRFANDPYANPDFARDPIQRDHEVVVVGGGFGGLQVGAQLRQAGFDDVCIIEKASDFGGVWYWNRYPGVACDTESYVYFPLLEDTGYMPTAKYARGEEIREHAQRIGRQFDLYRSALFQTVVTEARWLQDIGRWRISTDRGDELRARFLILAGGPLNRPKLPGIPGIETFKGHSFHASRWDYTYTGGDANGNLTGLRDKRIGIIGTGATGVQSIPHLGASAKELYVFQRTPSSVDARNNRPTDPDWAKSLKPGWHRERMENFSAVLSGEEFEVDLVNDGWTDIIGSILLAARRKAHAGEHVADEQQLIQLADYKKMERVRARIGDVVKNKPTAEALKPWYNQFCKRPCFHDEYLDTFNRSNVHLVDTEGRGVERITEKGVVVAGREYELDCLIFGTGFEWGTDYTRRMGFEIYGRNEQTLTDKWADGVRTFHGIYTRGFPNLLFMMTTHSGISSNFVHILDVQARHIAYVLSEMRGRSARVLETSQQAESEYTDMIVNMAKKRESWVKECTPSFFTNEGIFDERSARSSRYARGFTKFIRLLADWREEGNLQGLEYSTLSR